jgi:hypothetical protein
MFGRMMLTPILQVGADADLQSAIYSLLQSAEQAEIVRWIEFPHSVLLFLLVPGDPESGPVYILSVRSSHSPLSITFHAVLTSRASSHPGSHRTTTTGQPTLFTY